MEWGRKILDPVALGRGVKTGFVRFRFSGDVEHGGQLLMGKKKLVNDRTNPEMKT